MLRFFILFSIRQTLSIGYHTQTPQFLNRNIEQGSNGARAQPFPLEYPLTWHVRNSADILNFGTISQKSTTLPSDRYWKQKPYAVNSANPEPPPLFVSHDP